MRIYFEGTKPDYTPREQGKLALLSLVPESNGPKVKPVRMLIAGEIKELNSGDEISLGFVGKEKNQLMVFPPKGAGDMRIVILIDIASPGHRKHGHIRAAESTGKTLQAESGYGAWGSGTVAICLLEEGQYMVTNEKGGYMMYKNIGGILEKTYFDTEAEFQLHIGNDDVTMI